jgi:hypothetical protein
MIDDDELNKEVEITKLKRAQNALLREKQEYIESTIKKLKAEGKTQREIEDYLNKHDDKLKEINSTLKLNAAALRQYHNESKLTVESIARQEQGLKSISGVQSSLVDNERKRLTIQHSLTSISDDFHIGLNSIGDTTKELASLTSEDVVQRDQLIKQGEAQLRDARSLLEFERTRHQEAISGYEKEKKMAEDLINSQKEEYRNSITERLNLENDLKNKVEARNSYEMSLIQRKAQLEAESAALLDKQNENRQKRLNVQIDMSSLEKYSDEWWKLHWDLQDIDKELSKNKFDITLGSPILEDSMKSEYAEIEDKLKNIDSTQISINVADATSALEGIIEKSININKNLGDQESLLDSINSKINTSIETNDKEIKLAEEAIKIAEENLEIAKNISKLSEHQQKFLNEQVELYDGIKNSIGKVWETFSLLFTGIRGFFATVLIGAGMLVDKISEVNKELGLTLLETNSFSLSIMGLGMIFGDAKDTAEELASQLGGMNEATFGLQLDTNIMAANLGIAGGEAASLVGSFSRLNEGSSEVALDMMRSVKETAKLSGVIPSKVMKDLANNTEAFALYGKDGGKNIAEAAVYAAKLGVGMDKLTGIADNLLDFESSITSELELSAMLGRNINLERARSLAYEGKIEEAVSETLNQLGGIEAFNNMDYFQKKQAAQLLGVSVDELQKMAANQHKVGQEVSLAQKGFDRFNESVAYMSNTLFGSILKGAGGLLVTMGQVGTGLSSMGIDTKKIFGSIFSFIKAPFKLFASSIKGMGGLLKKTFTGAGSLISSMFKKDEEGKGFFTRIKDGFSSVKTTISSIGSSISGLFKKDGEGKGFFTRMKDGFKSIFGGKKGDGIPKPERLRDERGRFISATPKPEISGGTSISESAKGVDKVAKGGKELEKTKSIGDKLKDLAKGLQAMGTTKVLAGALNLVPTGLGFLLMLPGIPTLFLLSKMDISSVGKGLGSLGKGLEKLGSTKVLFGAFNLIPIGLGFTLMTLGMIGMGLIALLGIPLGAGLTAMSVGLTAMGNPAVFMGALGILAVGASLIPFTFALSLLKGVDIGVILSTVGALVVFGIAAAAIGSALPLIAMGALGIGLIGLSLIPFTYALSQLQGIDMSILLTTAASLMVFGVSASMLGILSPLILLGSIAIATLSLALIPFTFAMSQLQGLDSSILITAAVALGIFGVSAAAIGAASLLILVGAGVISVFALSLIPFTYALSQLKGVDPMILLTTAGSLAAFGIVAAGIGLAAPLIVAGSAAISILSLALIPFTYAMAQLQQIDSQVLISTAISLSVFAAIASGMGIFAPLIIAGSVAISILGLALIPFTYALSNLSSIDPTMMGSITTYLLEMSAASFAISAGLAILTVALLGFGSMIPVLLLSSVAFMVFGTSLMLVANASSILATTMPAITDSLKQLTEFSDSIYGLSGSILALAGSMSALSLASLAAIPFLPIIQIIGKMASTADSGTSESAVGSEEGGSSLSSLESTIRTTNDALLMEIKGLREDLVSGKIGISMDGESVTSKVTKFINRSTQNVTGLKV